MVKINTTTKAHLDTLPKRESPEMEELRGLYREALRAAIEGDGVLVIEIENHEKPMTHRQRIRRAAAELGYDVRVRQRENKLFAYETNASVTMPADSIDITNDDVETETTAPTADEIAIWLKEQMANKVPPEQIAAQIALRFPQE